MKYVVAAIRLTCSSVLAQLIVVNSKNLEFPLDRLDAIFRMACKVVAEEFHGQGRGKAPTLEFPLILVLGDANERYTEDEQHQHGNAGLAVRPDYRTA